MTSSKTDWLRRAPVTWSLIAANLAIYFFTASRGAPLDAEHVFRFGGDLGVATLGGQWWRLVSSLFLHFSIGHVASNMFCLAFLGYRAERIFGSRTFLAAYLGSGILGDVLSVLVHPEVVSAGASGAVFGVAGMLLPALAQRFQEPAWPDGPPARTLMGTTVRFVVYNLLYSLAPGVDAMAHLGGFAAGIGFGFALRSPSVGSLPARRAGLTLAGAAVVMVGGLSAGHAMHRGLIGEFESALYGPSGTYDPFTPIASDSGQLPGSTPNQLSSVDTGRSDSLYNLGLALFARGRDEADRGARDSALADFRRVLALPSDSSARVEGLLMAARHLADSLGRRSP